MLSFSATMGKPIAIVKGGKYNNQIIYLEKEKKNI
jgi:hypothetical protein